LLSAECTANMQAIVAGFTMILPKLNEQSKICLS